MSTTSSGPVVVRFAPSPTGFLHVGGARTAIYNDLLRQRLGGRYFLRIEDTDKKRSDASLNQRITDALEWVGVRWDEGPVLQSASVELHRAAAAKLLASGHAYRCFVTAEELEAKRKEVGQEFRYRDCFALVPSDEATRRAESGEAFAVRCRMPTDDITIVDMVRGEVTFPADVFDDFIILRSDGSPTYHLSVVCDDVEMGITHVLRGDDHLSNVPKHVALFRALGAEVPTFGHLPLIMGADGKRLSKRTGATSVEEFQQEGILPEALYNYLALLGWSPGGDRELMSRDEMIDLFSPERFGTSAATFDYDKLGWMNAQYMSSLDRETLLTRLAPFLGDIGLGTVADAGGERLELSVDLHRGRTRTLRDLAGAVAPYFRERLEYDVELCGKFLRHGGLPEILRELVQRYGGLDDYTIESTDQALRALAKERGEKAGALIHPTRMALTGAKAGPPLFDVVVAMGREDGRRHLLAFADFLEEHQEGSLVSS